ncbi:fatty acid/phospholipid synthesis protein PlsX [Denitrovibrio acetiphilus DSM 12809]|uniref:Phosphate acyltransferase n=1 Tax=Denitrovibrio acetiphilus (strain DSM 12809 / NBRC 114555 / N2460) TaxID=522772 RepID=D4H754_DENA2|nr:phosphate acyltransferase PlsX [Denitrovibrio acetiphilus]ADD69758.1 fatty acid/phospholipid synthesis protein PlsX [Denitrovibrio acetiphilus DSM 12809]
MKVVVDAMGGDNAPREIVKGAVAAVKQYGMQVILVGDEQEIRRELESCGGDKLKKIEVVHAEEKVEMDDSPSQILRTKRNSSIHQGLRLVKQGDGAAFFSAGNTGAVMACAKMILKTLPGIDRPAIAAVMPTVKGATVMCDVGANVDCKIENYVQFAIMASAYASLIMHKEKPSVGLMSVGEEDVKGNDITKNVFKFLSELGKSGVIDFYGNVEGKDVFKGTSDVIVVDGFAGNVALKVSESAGWYVSQMLKEELRSSLLTKIGAILLIPALKRIKKRADHSEYGGAPLLGVNGVCIIGHGSANETAVKYSVKMAHDLAVKHLNGLIAESIAESVKVLNVDKEDSFWNNIVEKFKRKTI